MSRRMFDSGVEWIGEIPDDWSLGYIGQIYSERKEKVSDRDYAPLSVTMKGIVPQLSTAAKTDAHDERKLVKKGDFAINSRSDRRGSCGISPMNGSVSLINTVLKPKGEMNPNYYNWLFHTSMFADEFYKWGHGIVDDLWTTNWGDMKKIVIPIPPLKTQENIADLLKEKCSNIDSIITKTQASIEEYKNLYRAIIMQAVTKGIRGDRPMKDSGVAWIGEIPEEWDVKRNRFIATSMSKGNGITKEDVKSDGDIQCVRYGEIYSKYDRDFCYTESRTNVDSISFPKYISKGNILFTCTGELIEEIGKNVVYMGDLPCLAGGDIIVMEHEQNPKFLNYALNSSYSQSQKSSGKIKLKVVHISAREIGNVFVALPPMEEQIEIADYLDQKCTEIDSLISKKEQFLTEIDSYKKSMIYEYVTGKKEVM